MVMSAGRRIHEVVVQNPSGPPVADGDGGFTQAYADLSPRTLWVAIETATETRLERLTASSSISAASHIVTGPYHAGVTTKTRLTYGVRTLYVVGVVDPQDLHIETVMICNEVVA